MLLITQATEKVCFCILSGLGETRSQLFFLFFFLCSSTGDGLVNGRTRIYTENAETIRNVAIVKRKVLIFFSQSTQLKFSSLNTWSKFSRMIFFSRSLFSRIDGKSTKFVKIRSHENFMPHGIPLCSVSRVF